MSGVLYFAIFVFVVVIIAAMLAQLAYKQQRITRAEARFRELLALIIWIVSIIFVLIAAYLHVSIWLVLLGFVFLIFLMVVIGITVLLVLQRK